MAFARRYLVIELFLCFALAMLMARGAAPPARRLSFTVFSAQPIAGLCFLPRPNAEPKPLRFYPTARSPVYDYTGAGPIHFRDGVTGDIVAEAALPLGIQTALLMLFPAEPTAGQTMRYRVQVIDDSVVRHAPGTLLILNLSGLELRGVINHHPVALQAGFNPPLPVGETAAINLRTPFRDRSYQAFAETVPLERASRVLLLLLPPYRAGSLEVQSRVLVDSPAPPVPLRH